VWVKYLIFFYFIFLAERWMNFASAKKGKVEWNGKNCKIMEIKEIEEWKVFHLKTFHSEIFLLFSRAKEKKALKDFYQSNFIAKRVSVWEHSRKRMISVREWNGWKKKLIDRARVI
jgi:hypothetical protein